LHLLAWRADATADKHPDATWPELAEYDCFACHHDLEDPSWRRRRVVAGLPLGQPAWGTWYFGPLRQMNDVNDGNEVDVAVADQSLALLTEQMQAGFGRDRARIHAAASTARRDLARRDLARRGEIKSLARFGQRMRRALDELAGAPGRPESDLPAHPASWDEAVQLYLAIVAMDQAKPTIDAKAFAATRELFAFPPKYDSPRGFFGERMPGTLPGDDPPATASQRSRTEIIAALIDLIQQLEPPGN